MSGRTYQTEPENERDCALDFASEGCKNSPSSPRKFKSCPAHRRKVKAPEMSDAPIPSVVAMLICEHVIVEQGTGAKSLIAVFENVNSHVFPVPTRMAVYAKLLDADGSYDFLIRLINLKDEAKIADVEAKNVLLKSATSSELVLNIAGLVLPEPGKYEFQLYANDVYLHRATINAVHIQGGPAQWPQPQSHQ